MSENLLYFNGIDAATGSYLLPPLRAEEIARVARGASSDPAQLLDLRRRLSAVSGKSGVLELIEGVDPKDLARAGWGIIFSFDSSPAIREALRPLLDLRKGQAALVDPRHYREFSGLDGYHAGETKQAFLARHGVGPGPANPDRMPYYLLIVGSPGSIPFAFQYQLDVQYAVGRIHFDTAEEYANYARSVVAAETGKVTRPCQAAFFGVQNHDDGATALSAANLVKPLFERFAADKPGWETNAIMKDDATKPRLGQLLGGADTPALLFTASHGMGFRNGDPNQMKRQGALLCGDWPGPLAGAGPIQPEMYFSADDVQDTADLSGLISFHFACYGAGTPQMDDFYRQAFQQQAAIAPAPFIGGLPRRLLGHPKGSLAFVGHIERAWGYSFMWAQAGQQVDVFQSTLKRLAEGHPVGSALEFFNQRYAELASDLAVELENEQAGSQADDYALAGLWTANNDARNYAIIGDPAVRLPVRA